MPAPALARPPLYTVFVDLVGWTLQRTADIPKSHRFSFGQRIDNRTLDGLGCVIRALYTPRARKRAELEELNLVLEELRVLWRLVNAQGWISQQQLVFVTDKIDEAGRMTGGWLRQIDRPAGAGKIEENSEKTEKKKGKE